MGGQPAVGGRGRPFVVEDPDAVPARAHHGFDGDDHARAEPDAAIRPAVIGDLRFLPETAADPVSAQVADHRVSVGFHVFLHRVADVADTVPRLRFLDPLVHRRPRDVQQPLRLGRDPADGEGKGRIAVVRIDDHGEIEAEDVPFLDRPPRAGDAVHDLLVDGRADRGGKGWMEGGPVSQKGRGAFVVPYHLPGDFVQIGRGDTRLDGFTHALQRCGGGLAAPPDGIDLFFGLDNDAHSLNPDEIQWETICAQRPDTRSKGMIRNAPCMIQEKGIKSSPFSRVRRIDARGVPHGRMTPDQDAQTAPLPRAGAVSHFP